MKFKNPQARVILEEAFRCFHHPRYLFSDPLEFPRRYRDPHDQEAVALLSAILAYGNVKQIRGSIEDLLGRLAELGESPSECVRAMRLPGFRKRASRGLKTFVHRFNKGEDIFHILDLLSQSWDTFGSMGMEFNSYFSPSHLTIEKALTGLIQSWKGKKKNASGYLYFLLSSPQDQSACKRWCMFLRWMIRKDQLDLGNWQSLTADCAQPRHLVLPLDTHTGRLSKQLGLTRRKVTGWKMALEVSSRLAEIDKEDPTRFDFSLSRIGILQNFTKSEKLA